jgi:hypothetical protein
MQGCKGDAPRFRMDVKPGQGRIIEYFGGWKAELSKACMHVLYNQNRFPSYGK